MNFSGATKYKERVSHIRKLLDTISIHGDTTLWQFLNGGGISFCQLAQQQFRVLCYFIVRVFLVVIQLRENCVGYARKSLVADNPSNHVWILE